MRLLLLGLILAAVPSAHAVQPVTLPFATVEPQEGPGVGMRACSLLGVAADPCIGAAAAQDAPCRDCAVGVAVLGDACTGCGIGVAVGGSTCSFNCQASLAVGGEACTGACGQGVAIGGDACPGGTCSTAIAVGGDASTYEWCSGCIAVAVLGEADAPMALGVLAPGQPPAQLRCEVAECAAASAAVEAGADVQDATLAAADSVAATMRAILGL